MVLNYTNHCPSERLVGVWRINFPEDQICSSQGFGLIVGAIRHHFRSYLEAEPEVQAEIALHQTMRAPKGTFVEYTSRISNKLREMESGFKEFLPPKVKGFIVKRQAESTHDQAKHPHFYTPTRGLEADKMVDALNRLKAKSHWEDLGTPSNQT